MGHRDKHLRRNWSPDRLAAAQKRAEAEAVRQAEWAERAETRAQFEDARQKEKAAREEADEIQAELEGQ